VTEPQATPAYDALDPDNASILVAGGGGVALHVTRRLKDMGSWVWQLQRTDVRRKVRVEGRTDLPMEVAASVWCVLELEPGAQSPVSFTMGATLAPNAVARHANFDAHQQPHANQRSVKAFVEVLGYAQFLRILMCLCQRTMRMISVGPAVRR
jgi:hypothetical protein